MDITITELIAWTPKGVLFGALVFLGYVCTWVIKYIIKTTYKGIMDQLTNINECVIQMRDSMTDIKSQLANTQKDQHELKETIFNVKDHFEKELKHIKKRIELIESR